MGNLKIADISHYHRIKEPNMASLTEEQTIPQEQNEPQSRTAASEQTPKSALQHFQEYARERPGVVALWCVGVGFVLGWKLKLW
jgi:hypothetical protein